MSKAYFESDEWAIEPVYRFEIHALRGYCQRAGFAETDRMLTGSFLSLKGPLEKTQINQRVTIDDFVGVDFSEIRHLLSAVFSLREAPEVDPLHIFACLAGEQNDPRVTDAFNRLIRIESLYPGHLSHHLFHYALVLHDVIESASNVYEDRSNLTVEQQGHINEFLKSSPVDQGQIVFSYPQILYLFAGRDDFFLKIERALLLGTV